MFAERLLRGTEVQTQHPSGFSQVRLLHWSYWKAAHRQDDHRGASAAVGCFGISDLGAESEGAVPSQEGLDGTYMAHCPEDGQC